MRDVFELAAAAGRNYITPEDVTASRESGCPGDQLRTHVMQAMAGVPLTGKIRDGYWGIEDKNLTCRLALEESDQ